MSEWYLQEPGTADPAELLIGAASEDIGKPNLRSFAESRNAERYFVRWKMAIIFEDQESKPTYRGKTHDLSLVGTGMLTDVNLHKTSSPVIILLAPPPLHTKDRPKIIEVKSRQLDVVYSGAAGCFRIGFAFLEFKNDGMDQLAERLRHHKSVTRMPLTKPVH